MMLVDLCQTVRPHIVLVDAIDAMEGNGPSGGQPRHVGALIGGTNPYNVDLVGARLMHMKPEEIYMMSSAIERGLCPSDVEGLTILGEPLSRFVVEDFLQPESKSNDFIDRVPKILRPLADKIATPRPKIRTKDCVGCGKCAESCPQHTIAIRDKKAVISYGSCIKCFCCHEMCPAKAIDIQRLGLFSL
jgi:ferredoxin